MIKKSFISLITAGAIVISLTGCGDKEPEGIYTCSAEADGQSANIMKIKLTKNSWDIMYIQGKPVWMIADGKEQMVKKGNGSVEAKLIKNNNLYTLNINGTDIKGKAVNQDMLDISYDAEMDTLKLTKLQGLPINKTFTSAVSCKKTEN